MVEIISRSEARARGLTRYFTGMHCPRGHSSERFVSNKTCVTCGSTPYKARKVDLDSGRKRNAAWYAANKDEIRARRRQFYAANRQEQLARLAERRATNPQYAERRAEWYRLNRDQILAKQRAYWKAHPELRRVKQHNRELREREAGKLSKDIAHKLLKLQKCKCANCHANLNKVGYHLDHIMPISLGGMNVDHNIQLLCPDCNLRKHAKHPIDWAQQQGRLL